MLVRDDPPGWLAIGQASHAWVSGQIARAWGTAELPAPDPGEPVCLAAEQHDVGMAAWDRRPTHDAATGRATAFTAMPRPLHLALWSAAAERIESQSRYAALLVSLHGTSLYTTFGIGAGEPEVARFLAGQRAYQERLIGRLDADREALERHRRLVFAWDALSLALCLGWDARELPAVTGADGRDRRLRYAPAPGGATLEPWPFAAAEVHLEAEGRRMPDGLPDEAALHEALDGAAAVALRWTLRPAGAGGGGS